MNVKDLKPRTNVDEIVLEIISKGEPRNFANERGTGRVANCAAKDEEGNEISLTLWNEQIDQINEGNKVKISNGWVSEFRGQLQLSTGKKGIISIIE